MSVHLDDVQAEPWHYQKVKFPPEPAYRFVDSRILRKLFSDKGGFIVGIFFAIATVAFYVIHNLSETPSNLLLYISGGALLLGIIIVLFIFRSSLNDVKFLRTGDAVPAFLTDFTLVSNTKTTRDSKGRRQRSTDYWLEGAVFFEYQNRWYHWEFKLNSDSKAKKLTKKYYAGDIVTLLVNDEILQSQKVKIYQFFNIKLNDEEERYIDEQQFQEAINNKDVERVTFKKHIQRKYDRTFNFNTKNSLLKGIFNLLGNTVAKASGTTDDAEYLDIIKKQAQEKTNATEDKFYSLAVPPAPPRLFENYIVDNAILPDYKKSSKFWWLLILFGIGIFVLILLESDGDTNAIIGGGVFGSLLALAGILGIIVSRRKKQAAIDARKKLLLEGESAIGIITDIRIGRYEKYDEGVLNNVESKLKFCYTFVATGVWHQEDFIIVNETYIRKLLNNYHEGDLISIIYQENQESFCSIPVTLLGVHYSEEATKQVPRVDVIRDLSRSFINPNEY